MQDPSVHGKEELSSDLSFASKTAYFSHFDPPGVGSNVRLVPCQTNPYQNINISDILIIASHAVRSQPFEGIGPSLPPGLKTLAASVASEHITKHTKTKSEILREKHVSL